MSSKLDLRTNLKGRLRNTPLSYNNGLLPMYESVVNSIHAIEEANLSSEEGKITIEIVRTSQKSLDFDEESRRPGPEACEDIVGFKITDNGIGFDDTNMESFKTLDSDHKAEKGGRGIGRLLWLKAFRKAKISSVYKDENHNLKLRAFSFTIDSVGDLEEKEVPPDSNVTTTVFLEDFKEKYRKASLKTTKSIANSLFEHCLWYFVRDGGCPRIFIRDGNEASVDLDEVYHEHMTDSVDSETIDIKEEKFDLTHIKLRSISLKKHILAYCSANRLVEEENITGKIPGLYRTLRDAKGEFVYACYVRSSYLDENVRPERTGFNISEDEDLFADVSVSRKDIRGAIFPRSIAFLSEYLSENKKLAHERVEEFVTKKAPRYRPLLSRIPEDQLSEIDPDITDKELDVTLHKELAKVEEDIISKGHDIMSPKLGESTEEYEKRLQDYLKDVEDIKKSDLASYVVHRKVILDILENSIKKDDEGNYVRERFIHDLIMPVKKTSNELMFENCNLWLIDERLAFHDYLASDTPLNKMPITNSEEPKRPDICALNVYENPLLFSEKNSLPLSSIIVIEIKKPMRNDASRDNDPIQQSLDYLEKIREGRVQTARGRKIPNSENIPGFCYVLCDITSTLEKLCKGKDLTPTSDRLGYFGYNSRYKAYIEVISFDRLVNGAKERNKAFFDKLGLPTT